MPPSVEQIVVPLGLVTQPNHLGQFPPGALSQAMGVVLRSPGLLTRAPQFAAYNLTPFTHAEPMLPLLLGASDSKLFHISKSNVDNHQELSFFDGVSRFGNDLNAAGVPYQPITFDLTGRVTWTRSRDRFLFNSDQGVVIVDSANPTSNALALPRLAGLPQPILAAFGSVVFSADAGALAINTWCAGKAVIRRTSADGYVLTSADSAPLPFLANGAAANLQLTVFWHANTRVLAGDVIEFYRTRAQPNNGATATNAGAVYLLSSTHTVTAGEAAGLTATWIDATADALLQAELYTNPGQGGANATRLPPPNFKALTTFRGYTFGFNRTDPASITLTVQTPVGILPVTAWPRKYGIGTRTLTVTFTNTSNVLTAISAADIVGAAVGQRIQDAAFVTGIAFVTAVGVNTLTMSQNANATVTKAVASDDMFEINGSLAFANALSSIVSGASSFPLEVIASELVVQPGFVLTPYPPSFSIVGMHAAAGSFTVRASNGQNYVPALPDMSATALTLTTKSVPNGIAWSELQQPEAWPPPNTAFVGSGTIYGAWATRDAIWIFASDGLWRLTGTGGSAGRGFDWRIDPVDSTLSLSGPQAACVLRDTVYAYTNRGLVAIGGPITTLGGSVVNDTITNGVVGDLLPGPPFSLTTDIKIAANETDDEIWLGIGTFLTYYIYNTLTKAWTNSVGNGGHKVIAYARFLERMAAMDQVDALAHSTTLFESPSTVDYQPIANGDPLTVKQWIDATLVAAAADATKSVTPRFNGTAYTARTLTSQNQDARTSWAIPRNAPAVANSLAPGFSVTGTGSSLSLYGFALRANALTNQRKQR